MCFTFGFFQRGWEPFELAFTWVVEGGRGRGASGDSSSASLAEVWREDFSGVGISRSELSGEKWFTRGRPVMTVDDVAEGFALASTHT